MGRAQKKTAQTRHHIAKNNPRLGNGEKAPHLVAHIEIEVVHNPQRPTDQNRNNENREEETHGVPHAGFGGIQAEEANHLNQQLKNG